MGSKGICGRSKVVLGIVAVCAGVAMQPARVHSQDRGAAWSAYDPSYFAALRWRNIGPNRGGRSIAAAGSTSRPLEYYFGATGGGLWKTVDGGTSWLPVTDGQIRSSSVGAIGVAESRPDVVYIGMGEVELRGNILQGDGVYKSTDAGRTWTHVGLERTQAIGRVRVHPTNPDVVYVAALGHPYAANDERGVFRTTDGGKTWTKVLFRSDRAGAVDLCMDPHDPRVLYAAIWEVYRRPWMLSSGGEGSGLFKSIDGGDTWTELTRHPGLPKGTVGKIGVTVSGADSKRVWVLVEAVDGGLFRSDDGGETWIKVNEKRDLWQRAFYFSRTYADPRDRGTLYVLNYMLQKSVDGGKTFAIVEGPPADYLEPGQADYHDLWIDPANPARMICSNDGGAMVTVTGGRTWTGLHYPTAQMYHVATTRDFPYHVCGAQQDNTTACVRSDPPASLSPEAGLRPFDVFYAIGGNESGTIAAHATNPNILYASGQEGYLTRYDRTTGQLQNIQPYPWFFSGQSAGSVPERWQWTFPVVVSLLDPTVIYTASQHLWRSTNEGHSWARISPDLTRAVPATLGDSGGPITKDQNGPEFYATIFAVAPSRRERDTIWVGSDDGLVHLTRDGGRTWQPVTPADMPEFTRVSLIDASSHQAGTAYLAGKRHQLDDRAPYIWRTHDYGKTWTKIVNGIRADDFVHAVREDPTRPGLLYAGTEHGVYVSFDDGAHWQSLSLNLPDTPVADLVVEAHDLVIATHGRSFYVLDDIEPIRQLTPEVVTARAHLFEPRDAVARVYSATIDYYLKAAASGVTVEVVDGKGAVIWQAANPTLRGAGSHRVSWDVRYPGATVFPGMILRDSWPEQGPFALPGRYAVRLTVDGERQTRDLVVSQDPRLTGVTRADLEEQFALALQIRDKTSAANEAVILIRDIRTQIEARLAQVKDPGVVRMGHAFTAKLGTIEGELYQVKNRSPKDVFNYPVKLNNRLAALMGVVQSADARPTEQTSLVFNVLSAELADHLAKLNEALTVDLLQLNRALVARNVKAVEVPPRNTRL
jgi:photosystem II stability/assembly factor-like uncharacterized protein